MRRDARCVRGWLCEVERTNSEIFMSSLCVAALFRVWFRFAGLCDCNVLGQLDSTENAMQCIHIFRNAVQLIKQNHNSVLITRTANPELRTNVVSRSPAQHIRSVSCRGVFVTCSITLPLRRIMELGRACSRHFFGFICTYCILIMS